MTHKTRKSAVQYASDIFEAKACFHKEQAKLSIEEKIRIMVELQKMVLNIQKNREASGLKQVWVLD